MKQYPFILFCQTKTEESTVHQIALVVVVSLFEFLLSLFLFAYLRFLVEIQWSYNEKILVKIYKLHQSSEVHKWC